MENVNEEVLKLRKRIKDLLSLGYLTPESGGTYEQTLLQIWQEADRRRISCQQQAETLRRQAAAVEAQAGAFTAMASILFNIVNGFVELGQRRLREEAERDAERQEAQREAEKMAAESVEREKPEAESAAPARTRRKKST